MDRCFFITKKNCAADIIVSLHMYINKILTMRYQSACGTLLLGSYGGRLCLCDWEAGHRHAATCRRVQVGLNTELCSGTDATLREASTQLDEYFSMKRRIFNVPLLFVGTEFQQEVWHVLQQIPYATTVSYAEEARMVKRSQAVRAVANANGANALSIFVPCHRVIGSNNRLTGYAGGLAAKQFLLDLELQKTTD